MTTLTPKILGNFQWHLFIIAKAPENSSYSSLNDPMADAVKSWCDENCVGQYMLSTIATSITCCLPTNVVSPLNVKFPTSEINSKGRLLLAFEKEEDAVLFKTTFGGKI